MMVLIVFAKLNLLMIDFFSYFFICERRLGSYIHRRQVYSIRDLCRVMDAVGDDSHLVGHLSWRYP